MRLVTVVAVMLLAAVAHADVVDDAWKRGNDAYFRGDYAAAVVAYQQLDRQGITSADLAYNLGVVHFRLGHLGPAIWAFERAAMLDPSDDDARFNLKQARALGERRARDKIEGAEREPAWIRAVTFLTAATQTWLFLGVYLGCFALLFLRQRAPDDSRAAFTAGIAILGAASVVSGLMLAGRMATDRIASGIVLPDAVAVKEGADPNYRTSFGLHAGLRVRLLDRDQDWVRIRLPNGLEGWMRAGDVGRL